MTYNVDYEICALVFLLLLMLSLLVIKHINDSQSKAYLILLCVTIFDLIFDIAGSIMINNCEYAPRGLNFATNTIFLLMQSILPYFLMVYVVILGSTYYSSKKKIFYIVSAIPAGFMAILTIVNIFVSTVFYIDDNGYHYGKFHSLFYIFSVLYMILSLGYTFVIPNNIRRRKRMIVLAMVVIIFIAVAVQFMWPTYNITGVGVALSLFILYLTVENPAAYRDPLTMALNRTAFLHKTDELRRAGTKMEVYTLALDNFKMVNEVYGMEGGDKVLEMLVRDLKRKVSKNDVYRYSGDIFAIVLSGKAVGSRGVRDIQKIVEQQWELKGIELDLSGCICHIPAEYKIDSPKNLIRSMDHMIAEAKKKGKGSVVELDDAMIETMKRRSDIEQALMAAVETGVFEVYYQVIYDSARDSFHSMEALARLNVPGYGYVSPEEFIRIAEQNGLITKIGMLVLEEVCRTIKEEKLWEYGIDYVEVNLSVVQCMRETLDVEIMDIIRRFGIPNKMINLEITESAAAYSEKTLVQNMEQLRKAGIEFSLDDYGTGYSNINYVAELPFSIIKIDKFFVWSAFKDEKMRKVLKNTIETFKNINFKVLAEGAEDNIMVEGLKEMGIDFIQGYYYSKPVPRKQMVEFLRKANGKKDGISAD